MELLLLKSLILCLIHLNITEVYSQPPKKMGARRSSFDNSIFRNRTNRCIKLIENVDELEELSHEPTNEEFDDIQIRQSEENLGDGIKETKPKKEIKKESALRRFMRCLTGRNYDPVDTIYYHKKDEEATIKKNEEDSKKAISKFNGSVIEGKTNVIRSGSRSYTPSQMPIGPKIVRKNSNLTGSLTEIGETRLPKTSKVYKDPKEELAIPGPSNLLVEKEKFSSLEERNEVRRKWFECNGDVLHNDSDKKLDENKLNEWKDDEPRKKSQ